jgi:hypothetical protein
MFLLLVRDNTHHVVDRPFRCLPYGERATCDQIANALAGDLIHTWRRPEWQVIAWGDTELSTFNEPVRAGLIAAAADAPNSPDPVVARCARLAAELIDKVPAWDSLHIEVGKHGFDVVEYRGQMETLSRDHLSELLRCLKAQRGMPISGDELRKACGYRDLGELIETLPRFVRPLIPTPGPGGRGGWVMLPFPAER